MYVIFSDSSVNLWFATGWPSPKRRDFQKRRGRRRQLRQPQTRGLSAGYAECKEATDMTKTAGIRRAKHGLSKPPVRRARMPGRRMSGTSRCSPIGHFLRGRSLKGRCNICVYVPVCVPVCVPRLPPTTSPILWG